MIIRKLSSFFVAVAILLSFLSARIQAEEVYCGLENTSPNAIYYKAFWKVSGEKESKSWKLTVHSSSKNKEWEPYGWGNLKAISLKEGFSPGDMIWEEGCRFLAYTVNMVKYVGLQPATGSSYQITGFAIGINDVDISSKFSRYNPDVFFAKFEGARLVCAIHFDNVHGFMASVGTDENSQVFEYAPENHGVRFLTFRFSYAKAKENQKGYTLFIGQYYTHEGGVPPSIIGEHHLSYIDGWYE